MSQETNTNITKFDFNGNEVRTITDSTGEVWFVVKDVCDVLEHTNPSVAIKMVDDDEVTSKSLGYSGPGNPNVNVVNESGLYTLIFRSNVPKAKIFRRWITHEVIPAIRKTGSYSMSGDSVLIMEDNYKWTMKRLDEVKAEKRKLVRHALEATPFWSNIKYYKDLGLSNVETGRVIEKSSRFVGRELKKMKALGIEPEAVPLPTLYQIASSRLEDYTTLLSAYRTRYPDADEDMMITYALPTREEDHE